MDYYLLIWNPEKDTLWGDVVDKSRTDGKVVSRFSCGVRKNIQQNDLVVMLRKGVEPKGVVGIGRVVEGSYQEKHWNTDSSREMADYVRVEWEKIDTQPFIFQDDAEWSDFDRLWQAQSGGVSIDESQGAAIFAAVRAHSDWSWLPTAKQFATLWAGEPPTSIQKKMLLIHFLAPEGDMHPQYLSELMGWSGQHLAHLNYGKFAHSVAIQLAIEDKLHGDKISLFCRWLRNNHGEVRWRMHSQVRDAIIELGWNLGSEFNSSSAAVSTQELFREGQVLRRKEVNFRGRNASVREHCLDHYKCRCLACGFDPIVTFGDEFSDLMDVHHLNPIAESSSERLTDPIKDCVPLCPNCHRLAHYGMKAGKCRTIDELKLLITN